MAHRTAHGFGGLGARRRRSLLVSLPLHEAVLSLCPLFGQVVAEEKLPDPVDRCRDRYACIDWEADLFTGRGVADSLLVPVATDQAEEISRA
jgi:hypothetical protein